MLELVAFTTLSLRRGLCAIAVLAALSLPSRDAAAQDVVEPYFLVMIDTSGSMGITDCADCPPFGTCSPSCNTATNSCGQPPSRMNAASCVLSDLINAYGDVQFGLGRFSMTCAFGPYMSECTDPNNSNNPVNRSPDLGEIIVPIQPDNQNTLLSFVDFLPDYPDKTAQSCPVTDPPEIVVNDMFYGRTPLAGTLNAARRYYEGGDPDFPGSPISADPFVGCRPYFVILLTDGKESCANFSDAETAANQLLTNTNVPGVGIVSVPTYVVALGLAPGDVDVEALALAGGTDAPGANRAFYAQNEQELSIAFSQIVQGSLLTEVCDNIDNDCDCPGDTNGDGTVCGPGDTNVDEGFVKYCDLEVGNASLSLCVDPGDPCDGMDDNCFNGIADEVTNLCGFCGPEPTEICNLTDDDCDGFIDEGNVCGGCSPEAEICDGKDNDCDGRFDEGITRPCGTDVGACMGGTQTCIEQGSQQPTGTWGPCNDVGPQPETCDGVDNNCDGLVDGFSQGCYTFPSGCTPDGMGGFNCDGICQGGFEVCTAGMFGACTGQIGPVPEICNGIDDDCDGVIDDGDPGGGGACGTSCGVGVLECQGGTLVCVGGGGGMPEVCNGLDDDCDGMIDEPGDLGPPIGDPCDEGGTLCVPGLIECVGGVEQCVGGVPPAPEVCDCEDNDCDGSTDEEDPDPLCPAGATCLAGPHCLCARPCAAGEFPCPLGFQCVDPASDGNRFCVPDPCAGVICDPLGAMGDATVCVDGTCEPICDTVSCIGALVCRASDGQCVEDNCNGFPERCTVGELCLDGTCVADPCDGVSCPEGQFCREGGCVDSCALVECPEGQSCESGSCVIDPCAGVQCDNFKVCDPATGGCIGDECLGRTCPSGQACNPLNGECEADPCFGISCPAGQVCQGGDCFDPSDLLPPKDPVDNDFVTPGGDGCAVSGGDDPPSGWLVLLFAFGFVIRRRRRL